MSRNIDRTEGGGPWRLPFDSALEAGERRLFDLERMTFKGRKRYFADWLPIDNVQVKNLDSSEPVTVEMNNRWEVWVEPNAVDTFSEAGVTTVAVTNEGANAIPAENLVLHVSVEPYDADQQALEEKQRHPVESMVRGVFNL